MILKILRFSFLFLVLALVLGYVGVYLANHFMLQTTMDRLLAEDSRNQGLEVRVGFEHFINYKKLVVDFQKVGPPAGPMGVFRSFFQLSRELSDSRFDEVALAYRGIPRFLLDGETFTDLGERYGQVKLVELATRFGANLRFLNGDLVLSGRSGHYASLLNQEVHDETRQEETVGQIFSSFVNVQ